MVGPCCDFVLAPVLVASARKRAGASRGVKRNLSNCREKYRRSIMITANQTKHGADLKMLGGVLA